MLRERRAVLVAVPRAAAEEPDVLVLGVPGEYELAVGRQAVVAAGRARDRGVREGGEPVGEVLACDGDPLGGRLERTGVGIDLDAVHVGPDLEADALDAGVAVEGGVEVDPARSVPLGRGLEEDELLEGDPRGHELGEEPAEPGAAGPDDGVGLEGGRSGLARRSGVARCHPHPLRIRPRLADHEPRARFARPPHQGPHPVGRPQHAGLRLVQHEGQVVHGDAREQARALLRRHPLDRDPRGPQHPLAVRLPAVLAPREPRHARLHQHALAKLAPQLGRPARRARVVLVGAVAAADQPRLAARLGTRVPGLEPVHQRDLPALAGEPVGHGRAEDTGPDDDRGGHDRPQG